MILDPYQLHVEISSRCTLRCPRCPRTEMRPETLNRDITVDQFRQAFSPALLEQVGYLLFCGDIGDPIYNNDLVEIVRYIKESSPGTSVAIVTNGSYKPERWWQELGAVLTAHDRVTFSVDGWDQASNEQYRVNSDWDSIITGIKTLKAHSDVSLIWSTIRFAFNEQRIGRIREIAENIGVHQFAVVNSTKFGSMDARYLNEDGVDPMEPNDATNTRVYTINRESIGRGRLIPMGRVTHDRHPWANCLRGDQRIFIGVDGSVSPCAWFGSKYMDNEFVEKYRDRLNIKTRNLQDILEDPCWEEFMVRLEMLPLPICKLKCVPNGQ